MSSKVQTNHDGQVTSKQRSSKPTVQDKAAITEHIHPATIIQRARFEPALLTPRDVLQLQRTIGNQAVQRLLEAHTVNAEGDSTTTDSPPRIQRFSGQSIGQMDELPASVDAALASPGRPLEPALRQDMGQPFGHDSSRLWVDPGIATAPGELEQPPLRLSARPPTTLPAATPAWTRNGEINLGPAGLFLAPEKQRRMLRHEAFHRLHQRIAPVSGTAEARDEAERLAANAEGGFGAVSLLAPTTPAPALLAFPPQPHTPWDRVFVGHTHIIGEVTEGGVVARILLSYKDIGITRAPEPQTYHCGKHDPAPIPTLVARMRKAAKQAADLNSKIPSNFPLRTAVIAIHKGANSAFREAGGQGVIVVKQEEPWEGTIAHEGSHGIFAFHLGERVTPGVVPDPLAQGIAELFIELTNTTAVSMPTREFDPKRLPPLKDDGKTATKPAGIVMVMDILWAGKGSSDGHPWDTADEFFASAFGAFQHDRPLFMKIVAHYGKADTKIPPLAQKLFALLAKVGDPMALATLLPPAKSPAIDAELKRVKPTTPIVAATDADSELLVNPNTLPGPAAISCPGAKPARTGAAKKAEPASQESVGQ